MKETFKVSIGGYVFIIDKDAYEVLNTYLGNIALHFQSKIDGNEIVSDIEYRMCELFQMKYKGIENIVTLEDVQSVIELMGNPVDLADDELAPKEEKKSAKKRLFRDLDQSIVGGVCAGLGQYFHIDKVFFRVLFVVTVFFGHTFSSKVSLLFLFMYGVLWLVVPAAKTVQQKLAMSGEDPSIESIESGTTKIRRKNANPIISVGLKLLRVICFLPLFLIGISLLIAIIAFFCGLYVLDAPFISSLFPTLGMPQNTSYFAILLFIIPAIILIFLSVKLLTKFTKRSFHKLLVLVILWIVSFGFVAKRATKQMKLYAANETKSSVIAVNDSVDTLFVDVSDLYKTSDMAIANAPIYLSGKKPVSWFMMPTVSVMRDSNYHNFDIEIVSTVFDQNGHLAKIHSEHAMLDYSLSGSMLIFEPQIYSASNIWNREFFEFIIHCPMNRTVVVADFINDWRSSNAVRSYVFAIGK